MSTQLKLIETEEGTISLIVFAGSERLTINEETARCVELTISKNNRYRDTTKQVLRQSEIKELISQLQAIVDGDYGHYKEK